MKRHHIGGGILLAVIIALAVSVLLGVFATEQFKLNAQGKRIYAKVAARHVEQGSRHGEALPPDQVAALERSARNAAKRLTPMTLATPEPKTTVAHVRNSSSRNGAKVEEEVAHSTESPNVPGTQDVLAVRTWFDNPQAQASSTWIIDNEGNVVEAVSPYDKPWTQAWFNSHAISIEFVGYASQPRSAWLVNNAAGLRAGAELFAFWALKFGIPIQPGKVSGCTIVSLGVLQHSDLGGCGGGHHDAGPGFPMAYFISLIRLYADSLHATPKPKPRRPAPKPAWFSHAKTLPPMWAWILWRDHRHPAKLRPRQIPARVPAAWWPRYAAHAGSR